MPKIHWFAPLLLVLLGTSCIYKQPLVRKNALPVDPHFIGLWEEIPENEKTSNRDRMLVLKYSDTEYLVQQDEELYYRGYPIKIGGLDCIQLQLIGSNKGSRPFTSTVSKAMAVAPDTTIASVNSRAGARCK